MKEFVFVVLGGKYEQVPLILKAKQRGFKTVTFDYNKESPGKENSDYYFPVSYNDIPEIVELLSAFEVAGIATIGTNDAICVCSQLNAALGLNGLYDPVEIIRRATYKHLFRPHLVSRGLAVPRGNVYDSYQDFESRFLDQSLPLLVKPSDSSGNKGISIVRSMDKMKEAFLLAMRYARNGKAIAEEYIGDNSYAVESYIMNGNIIYTLIAERKHTTETGCSGLGLTLPAALPEVISHKMTELSERSIQALGLTHGPVHMDMVLDTDGNPYIIDIGPRLIAGPCGWEAIQYVTGFDPVQAVIDQALGMAPPAAEVKIKPDRFFAHRYLSSKQNGILKQIQYDSSSCQRKVKQIQFFVTPGDRLEVMKDSNHRCGYITATGDNFSTLKEKMDSVMNDIQFIVE